MSKRVLIISGIVLTLLLIGLIGYFSFYNPSRQQTYVSYKPFGVGSISICRLCNDVE